MWETSENQTSVDFQELQITAINQDLFYSPVH